MEHASPLPHPGPRRELRRCNRSPRGAASRACLWDVGQRRWFAQAAGLDAVFLCLQGKQGEAQHARVLHQPFAALPSGRSYWEPHRSDGQVAPGSSRCPAALP